jgi:hypothetical protein
MSHRRSSSVQRRPRSLTWLRRGLGRKRGRGVPLGGFCGSAVPEHPTQRTAALYGTGVNAIRTSSNVTGCSMFHSSWGTLI